MGRRRSRLIDDTDRYVIALIDALIAHGGTEYACCIGVAALLIGVKGPKADRIDAGRIVMNWERKQTQAKRGVTATLGGKASTFRAKRRRYRSAANTHWRAVMSAAFQAVFTLADRQQAKRVALAAAKIVGEAEFAYACLWPMIDELA